MPRLHREHHAFRLQFRHRGVQVVRGQTEVIQTHIRRFRRRANPECQIDSLPQSWAVISGVGSRDRIHTALDAVAHRLVRRESRLIQLFDPPFDKSPMEPGYIKGYVPGVRENGGQYTHAAIWTIMAFALAGETSRAWELFRLINPILHAQDATGVARYKAEPYVVAADVYSVAPHRVAVAGRGIPVRPAGCIA